MEQRGSEKWTRASAHYFKQVYLSFTFPLPVFLGGLHACGVRHFMCTPMFANMHKQELLQRECLTSVAGFGTVTLNTTFHQSYCI